MKKNSTEGNEFPDIDLQPTSTAHVDRYTNNKGQDLKQDEKVQKEEIEQDNEC